MGDLKEKISRNLLLVAALCLLSGAPPSAWAQNIKATVRGTVVDVQGGVLPAAAVAVKETEKGTERSVIADGAGRFVVTALEPGEYTVSVTRQEFQPYASNPFRLRTGDSVRLEITLQPEGGTVVIEVRSTPSPVSRDDAKLSRAFAEEEMTGLPVLAGGTGRNFYAQALTTPGAAVSTQAHRPFAVSGQRPRNNNYLIDSAEMNDANSGFIAGRGVTEQLISQEAVASFEIQTHNFKAEYGRNSGSVVSMVSKSGSNSLHGSLFWFHNNSALAARNFFESRKTSRRSNLAGFAVGGPLKRDKVFWFGNYETFRPRGQQLARFQTLTNAERAQASLAVQPLADLYPVSPTGDRVLSTTVPRSVIQHTYLFRGDVYLTQRQSLMLRTNYTDGNTDTTAIGNTVGSRVLIHNQTQSAAAHHSYLTPTKVNELRLGYTRQTEDDSFLDPPLLGNPAVNGEVGFLIVPGLSPGGFLGFLGRKNFQNNYQVSDDLTLRAGAHAWKFGSSLRRVQVNGGAETSGFRGQLFFPTVGEFLAGRPLSYTRNIGNPFLGLRRWEWHTYVQDDWQIRPNLMLNLGLRYELNTAPTEQYGRLPAQVPGDHNNFAPRVGLAWSVREGTVVRSGYGIYYNALEMAFLGLTRFNPPLFRSISAFRPQLPNLAGRAADALPSGLVVPDANTRSPYAQHYNLTIEQEVGRMSSFSVAYVGTSGVKLPRTRRPNGGENLAQAARPDPTVGVVNRLETSAASNYHGLQASYNLRGGRSMNLRLAYTYSRYIDDVSEFANTNQRLDRNIVPIAEDNLRLDRAVSDFHIPHMFTAAWSWQAPWAASRWFGGWTLSGITTLQSGRPLTLYTGTNNRSGTDNNRPYDIPGTIRRDRASAVPFGLASGIAAAAITPPAGLLGTLGRNTERTDSLLTWNFAIRKEFPVAERVRAEIRGELFNALNTTNFNEVDTVLSSPSFGRALTAFDPRTAQLALRIVF